MTIVRLSTARVRARHADAGGEVVEVEQHLDQPGAAEVVERDHAAAEGGDEPVARAPRRSGRASATRLGGVGGEVGGSGRGLRRRHLLDALVDRGVDGGVEVRHRGEHAPSGRRRRVGAVEVGERRAAARTRCAASAPTVIPSSALGSSQRVATSSLAISAAAVSTASTTMPRTGDGSCSLDPADPSPSAERRPCVRCDVSGRLRSSPLQGSRHARRYSTNCGCSTSSTSTVEKPASAA